MTLWNGIIVSTDAFCTADLLQLAEYGINKLQFDPAIFAETQEMLTRSSYNLKAQLGDAPQSVNCLTLMSWIFQQCGIMLVPILEVATIGKEVAQKDIQSGDLLFTKGLKEWYCDPDHGSIGHVGIAASHTHVLHATKRKGVNGVIKETLEEFLDHTGPLRTIRRLIAQPPFMTLVCSAEAWLRDPPTTKEKIKRYIDAYRNWFAAQLVDA